MQVLENTWSAAEMERDFGYNGPPFAMAFRPFQVLPLRDALCLKISHVMGLMATFADAEAEAMVHMPDMPRVGWGV